MMKKRSNFLSELRKSQQARNEEAWKDVSQMSEAELDAEEARLRAELRRSKEAIVEAGRDVLAQQGSSGGALFPKPRRRYWK